MEAKFKINWSNTQIKIKILDFVIQIQMRLFVFSDFHSIKTFRKVLRKKTLSIKRFSNVLAKTKMKFMLLFYNVQKRMKFFLFFCFLISKGTMIICTNGNFINGRTKEL